MAKSILLVYYSKLMQSIWSKEANDSYVQVGGFTPFLHPPQMDSHTLELWLDQVQIEPVLARRWRVGKDWIMRRRVMLVDWMMWIEKGSLELDIEGVGEKLVRNGGMLMVVPAGVQHAARLHECGSAQLITMHFHAHLFGNLRFLDLLGMAGVFRCSSASPVADAMGELCREQALQGVGRRQGMRAELMRVLLYLIRNHGQSLRLSRRAEQYPHLARLQPILKMIDEGMDKSILSVPELAAEAAVSEVYLRRMFRQTLGISPAAYMQRGRVQRAGQLLRTTQLSVKEIARQSGFNDPHFLMRVFRKWMHQTPTEFREAREV